MSKKLRSFAYLHAFGPPWLKVCSVGVLGIWSGAPAWAQVAPAGTPASEDPTVDVDDAWREGRARGGDWHAVVGAGLRVAPDYEGADQLKLSGAPFAAISWRDRVIVDIRGITVYPVKTSNFRLGFSAGYAPGRSENGNDRLLGLGTIDSAARGALTMDYRLGRLTFGVDIAKDFGGSDGVEVSSSVAIRIPVAPRLTFLAGGNVVWSDSRYTNSFFGVTSAQSLASGLPVYTAGAGIKRIDADIGLAWALSPRLSARARVGIGRFVGGAADSPIVEKATQPFVGLSLARRF